MPLVNPVFANKDVGVAGEDLYRGEIIQPESSSGSLVIVKNAVDSFVPIGVVVKDAVNGSRVLFQYMGLAWVLPETAVTATKNYKMFSSGSQAGRVSLQSLLPSNQDHFRECGHVMEDGSGAGAIFRAVIHFN